MDMSGNLNNHDYWLKNLEDMGKNQFPYDYSNKNIKASETQKVTFIISENELEVIHKITNHSLENLYVILVSCLDVLIHKYTMDTDIIVGAPIYKQEIQGNVINAVLPLRNCIQEHMAFKQLIMAVKNTFLEANAHMNYPLEAIIEELEIQKDDFKLFDIAILLRNLQDKKYILDVNPSMIFEFAKEEDSLVGTIEYNSSIYKKESVQQIAGRFAFLLNSLHSNINRNVEEISVLLEGELKELTEKTAGSKIDIIERENTVCERFERIAKKYSNCIAVVCGDISLKYEELNLRANQVAKALQEKGVEKEKIVGILMDQSIEVVIGILGILKSDAAYLPIQLGTNKEQLDFIIKDSGMTLLLTKEKLASTLDVNIPKLAIDSSYVLEQNSAPVFGGNNGKDLAYVIYTSGTTGQAKGVMVEHRNLMNYVEWFTEEACISQNDKGILVSSFCFDLGYTSLYTTLLNGSELHIAPPELYSNTKELLEYLKNKKITLMKLTPSLFSTIVKFSEFIEMKYCQTLRLIVLGGERLRIPDVKLFLKHYPAIQMMNHYGPTETTIGCIFKRINEEYLQEAQDNYVIGEPIKNAKVYLFDRNSKWSPMGGIGEICIAGAGVSRGYLNREELTEKKFTQNPYSNEGETVYHTGDFGRILPNGNIAFIGREDDQIKIRGYRVELGEIEYHLCTHNKIQEVIVLPYYTDKNDCKLSAYFTSKRDIEIEVKELREFLANLLPEYMIPSYFIQIKEMPLTANGKINKRKLPAPKREQLQMNEKDMPVTELEQQLVAIWKDVFGINNIGVNTIFFEIGGDSLNATMIISKIHKVSQVKIYINDLFKYPSVRQLAKYIESLSEDKYIKIPRIQKEEYYAVSSAQKRMYLLHVLGANKTTYNTAKAIRINGVIEKQRIQDVFQKLIERHESLRTTFHTVAGEIVQKVHHSCTLQVNFINNLNGDIKERLCEFIQPFELSKLPLLRVYVFSQNENEHILFFDLPHIISDGVSTGILFREFVALFQGVQLEPLAIQYKDYAAWQNQMMEEEEYKISREYWKNKLSKPLPELTLPYDYIRSESTSRHGKTLVFEVSDRVFRELKLTAKEQDSTLFMVLFTGYCILLHKYTQGNDIIVGTPIAGRVHNDLQNIVGVFINTLAVRIHIMEEQTIGGVLNQVRTTMLEAYKYQDYPFEQLVDDLKIQVKQNRNPIFETMFVMEDFNSIGLKTESLSFSPVDFDNQIAHVDLLLMAIQMQNELRLHIEFSDELFEAATIRLIMKHYQEILKVMSIQKLKIKDLILSGSISKVEEVGNLESLEFII